MRKILFVWLISSLSLAFIQCKKDDVPDDENELITSVIFTFTDIAGIEPTKTFSWRDTTFSGNPVIENIELKIGTTYQMDVLLLDETKNPPDDVTEEILFEADDHQFFYLPNPSNLLTFEYLDEDSRGLPLGLKMQVSTRNSTGTGSLRAVLKHQTNIKDGNFNTGSTDADVTFPIRLVN